MRRTDMNASGTGSWERSSVSRPSSELIMAKNEMSIPYDESNDVRCRRCDITKVEIPKTKFMINVCGHALCSYCYNSYYGREKIPCYECKVKCKMNMYREQIFEDPLVDHEIFLRKNLMKIYNKLEEDFDTVEEWNLYLEEIEEIIYSLVNYINVDNIKKKIKAYQIMNGHEIGKNMKMEGKASEQLHEPGEKEDKRVRIYFDQNEHTCLVEQKYIYHPPVIPSVLSAPVWDEVESRGYLKHVRNESRQATAGGYTKIYACLRALQEFFLSLLK